MPILSASIPPSMLEQVDEIARETAQSRSAVTVALLALALQSLPDGDARTLTVLRQARKF